MTRPDVTVMCSASLDGRLAPAASTSSRPFISEVPERFANELDELREAVDGIVVGNRTVRHDDPQLLPSSGNPRLRVVVDPEGQLSVNNTVLADNHPTAVAVTDETDPPYSDRINAHAAKETISMGKNPDLEALLTLLGEQDINHLLLEGGGTLIYHFLDEKLIDIFRILYLPVFVGDKEATSLCDGPSSLFQEIRLNLNRRELIENHTLLQGRVEYNQEP